MAMMPREGAGERSEPALPLPVGRKRDASRQRLYRVATLAFILGFGILLGFLLSRYTRPRAPREVPTGVTMDRPGKSVGPMQGMEHEEMTGMARETNPGAWAAEIGKLEQAVEADPGNLETLIALGRAYMNLGRVTEGIETYKKVLAIDSRHAEALSTLGVVLLQSAHFDGALAAFDRALETDPGYPMALWGRGWAFYKGSQDYDAAIAAWETLQKKDPAWAERVQVAVLLREARQRKLEGARIAK